MPFARYIRYAPATVVVLFASVAAASPPDAPEQAVMHDGRRASGRIVMHATAGLLFQGDAAEPPVPLHRVQRVEFSSTEAPDVEKTPLYRVRLWGGDIVSVARFRLEGDVAQLLAAWGGHLRAPRGALAVVDASTLPAETDSNQRRRLATGQDQLVLASGDQWYGRTGTIDSGGVALEGDFGAVRLSWERLQRVLFRRGTPVARPVEGVLVRLHLRNGPAPEHDDVLHGALIDAGTQSLVLDHPLLGRQELPRWRARSLHVLGHATSITIEMAEHHLGNDVRFDLPLPHPEGNQLRRRITLPSVPRGKAYFVCHARHLESAAKQSQFAAELRAGHLRTQLWINGHLVDYLNRHVRPPADDDQRLRVEIPSGLLVSGTNTVRIAQSPLPYDKTDFDDFLLSRMAIEFVPPEKATDDSP